MGGADVAAAGDTGAAGAPTTDPTPIPATKAWLAQFCLARASETKACPDSIGFDPCYSEYEGFFNGDLVCTNDDADFTKLLALQASLDALSTACPMPDTSQIRCNLAGAPEFIKQSCQDADNARVTATMNCMLTSP